MKVIVLCHPISFHAQIDAQTADRGGKGGRDFPSPGLLIAMERQVINRSRSIKYVENHKK